MPAVPKWELPMTLTSPYGSLLLNQQTAGGIYLLRPDGCGFDIQVRSTKDNVPQGDGSILHHRFLTGTEMPLAIQLWEDINTLACDELAEEMIDLLTLHLRGLLNAGDNQGRLSWDIPSGGNDRMLDDIRLLVYPELTLNGNVYEVTTTIDSEYPYAQDLGEITTSISAGATETLNNTGNAIFYPVFIVQSTGTFTITNETTGTELVWDGAVPAGCLEVNCFRETIYVNATCTPGDGDGANLKYGIDMLNSDFPYLVPGNNDITMDGAGADVLWQAAYG